MPTTKVQSPETQRLAMVAEFERIRDLPYHISTRGEQDFSCVTKSQLLHEALGQLGVKSRFVTCSFKWEELHLPGEFASFNGVEHDYHQFLEVQIPGTNNWVDVDPTWDRGLAGILPVAEWDGRSSTTIAVPVSKRWYEDADAYMIDAREFEQDRATTKFIDAFNLFLARERSSHS